MSGTPNNERQAQNDARSTPFKTVQVSWVEGLIEVDDVTYVVLPGPSK